MIVDLNTRTAALDTYNYDILIVGAGTLGIFAASQIKILRPNLRIALIESGGRTPARFSEDVIQAGKFHFGSENGRATGLGGTSSLWGGQLAEFDEFDIERSRRAWGFDYEELVKYYNKTYEILGVNFTSGDKKYHETFIRGLGLDASDIEYFVTNWLRQPSFSSFFYNEIKSSDLTIFVNATAVDIDFLSLRCTSIEVENHKKKIFTFTAKNVIFANGTLKASQFFLSTGSRGRAPWGGNALVGAYFQDHIAGNLGNIKIKNDKLFREVFENGWINGNKVQPKIKLNRRLRRLAFSSVAMSIGYESGIHENLKNIKQTLRGIKSALSIASISGIAKDILAIHALLLPIIKRYMYDKRIFSIYDKKVYLYGQGEQIPLKESRLLIDHSSNGCSKLKNLIVDWKVSGEELSSFWLSANTAKLFFEKNGIAEVEINHLLQSKSPEFMQNLSDTYHMCGGLISSPSSSEGVVDTYQKVWGVENVWVLGSATFPSSSHANTTLTALALAVRSIEKSILQAC